MKIRLAISYLLAIIFLCLPVVSWAASVTLRWQANSEPDIAGYNIYYGTQSRAYSTPIPVGNVTRYTVNDLKDGKKYYFCISAIDTSGNESGFSAEISTTIAASQNEDSSDPTGVTVRANVSSPQVVGSTVTFTATAMGGSGSYEYRFYESNSSTNGQWLMVRDYSSNPSYSWNSTGKEGTGHIGVWARNQGGQSYVYGYADFTIQEAAKLTGVTLQADSPSPQIVGQAITFTALPKGGTGSTEYRFYEYGPHTDNQWVMVRDYSTNASFTWNSAGKVGKSKIGVWARNVGSSKPMYGSISYRINDLPKPTSVTVKSGSSYSNWSGATVNFTANAQGGTGTYEYCFWEYNASTGYKWEMVRDFSSSNSYSWSSTGKPGKTYIGVWARSAGGQGYVYSYATYTNN